MAGRVYCRDKKGREVPWGRGRPWADFTLRDGSGKARRFRVRVDADTLRQAELEMYRLMTEKAAELGAEPTGTNVAIPIGMAFDEWCASRRNHPKAASARSIEGSVGRFVAWVGRETPLADVDDERVAEYRDFRVHDQGRTGSTVSTQMGVISGFFNWCIDRPRGWIAVNPVKGVRRPKVRKKRPEALRSWEEAEKVVEAVRGHPVLEPAYRLSFNGVCREEIALARWEHIDLDRGTMTIDDGKTEAREVTIPLHDIALDWLKEHAQPSGYIVPIRRMKDRSRSPWGAELQAARVIVNKRRAATGLPPLPGFHKGRHTIGTLMSLEGAPLPIVQAMLRHSSPQTTLKYYVGISAMDARSWLGKMTSSGKRTHKEHEE